MAAQEKFVACPLGRWVQLCELRATRTSLLIELLAGTAILGINISGPNVDSPVGMVPAGILQSITVGNGPAAFRLSAAIDGDLVRQAWWAYVATTLSSGGTSQSLVVPAGVTQLDDVSCWGAGGAGSAAAVAFTVSGAGGGGGGYAGRQAVPVVAGQVVQAIVADGVAIMVSTVSTAGSVLTSASSGVAAGLLTGGAGGAGIIGGSVHTGGNGGPSTPVGPPQGNGGGAGGFGGNGGNGSVLGPGTGGGGPTGFGYGQGADGALQNNPGVAPGGGAGGSGIVPPLIAWPGGNGQVKIAYNAGAGEIVATFAPVKQASTATITVLEAFEIDPPLPPQKKFMAGLPKLSPDAILALHSLIAKIQSANEGEP